MKAYRFADCLDFVLALELIQYPRNSAMFAVYNYNFLRVARLRKVFSYFLEATVTVGHKLNIVLI